MESDRRAVSAEPSAASSCTGGEALAAEGPSRSAESPVPDGRAGAEDAPDPPVDRDGSGDGAAPPEGGGKAGDAEAGPRDDEPGESAGGDGQTPDDTVESLRARLDQARAEAEAEREAALRARAEAENVRRRAARDVEQAHRFGVEGLVSELLPVRDGLELGVEAAGGEGGGLDALVEGTEMTLRMLTAALQKFGVVEIDPAGEAFDPAFHQAMSMQEAEGVEPGRVLQVFQKGFVLHGRVVRPAMVIVSK